MIESMIDVDFFQALQDRNLNAIRAIPKSDLHNHCMLGGKRAVIEKFYGRKFTRFKSADAGIGDLNHWILNEFRPFIQLPGAFEKSVEAAFVQARFDGVSSLEMSIDASLGRKFNISPDRIVSTLKHFHQRVAPEIDFQPSLGFSKKISAEKLMADFESYLYYRYFRAVDLYDDELAQPIANFKTLYRLARKQGMKCTAHAGEFGSADTVKEAVETLELDSVQHGIGATGSPAVMKWLADHKIVLNVCPTSNIKLKRVRSYKVHPIRILFDHGVRVTLNTDDVLIFGDGVSEQFLKLIKAGVFNAGELEVIRRTGLELHNRSCNLI
jgi:adenosine deaminase